MTKFFTTAAGVQIEIVPVPPLLIEAVRLQAMEEVEVPLIPTYEVELADGTKLPYEHDKGSITDPNTTDAERRAWAEYQAALADQQKHSSTKMMDLFMVRGTIIDEEVINSGQWKVMQKYFKVKLPEDPFDLKIHYLRTELLTTTDDIYGLMSAIMELSGIDKNILKAAKNSFRGNLRTEQDATTGVGGEEQPKQEGEMAHQLPL